MTALTRRRFISISAAALAAGTPAQAATLTTHWRGTALGAGASMTISGLEPGAAAPLFARLEAELNRLENIFSLYRPHSALSQLNRVGALDMPPAEMLQVLSLSASLNQLSGGAFDPSVQPLWALHARAATQGASPTPAAIVDARARIGFSSVRFDATRITLTRPDMALTLNGIAQGYIADRISETLRGLGLKDVLVNMGEIQALGTRDDGTPWRAGITAPDNARPIKTINLSDRALATSAPLGTLLDSSGSVGHIFDPRPEPRRAPWRLASVSAPSAALADGLSTAFCLMDQRTIDAALEQLPGTRLELLLT